MYNFTFETVTEFNQPNLVEKASRMQWGLDTESDGPLLISPKIKAATKTLPASTKYNNFILMERSTTVGYSMAFEDGTSYYVPLNHRKNNAPYYKYLEQLRTIVTDHAERGGIHNLLHELKAFHQLGITLPPKRQKNLTCTEVLAHITDHVAIKKRGKLETPTVALKALSKHFLKHEMSDFNTVVGGTGGSFGIMDPCSERAQRYACEDAIGALLLKKLFSPRLKAWGLQRWFDEVEMPFVWALLECEQEGLPLDEEQVLRVYKDANMHATQSLAKFKEIAGVSPTSPAQMQAMFNGRYEPPFASIKSRKKEYQGPHQKVAEPLWPSIQGYKTVRKDGHTAKVPIPMPKSRKTGAWSTDAATLELLGTLSLSDAGQAALDALLEYRDYGKIVSTYSKSLLRLASQYPDGKIHPSYHQTGTVTGRLSSSYPSGQTFPSRGPLAPEVGKMIRAREGELFLSADYSQIDLRCLAHFAGGSLAENFRNGIDPHQGTADLMSVPRNPTAKTLNFAVVYGAQAATIARTLKCPKKQAAAFQKLFLQKRPKIPEFFSKVHDLVYDRGYIKSLSGRRRTFPEALSMDRRLVRDGFRSVRSGALTMEELLDAFSMERMSGNMTCQGSAMDVFKKGVVDLLFAKPADMLFHAFVHDDIRSTIKNYEPSWAGKKRAQELAVLKQECMEQAWVLRVPLVAVPVLGLTWNDLKGDEHVYE